MRLPSWILSRPSRHCCSGGGGRRQLLVSPSRRRLLRPGREPDRTGAPVAASSSASSPFAAAMVPAGARVALLTALFVYTRTRWDGGLLVDTAVTPNF